MKKCIVALGLLLSFGASAAPVFIYPTCYYGPYSGECTLYNSTDEVVTCNVQVNGQTRLGSMVYGFQTVTMYQRMSAWVRVYANNPTVDPLTYVTANAYCNTLN